MSTDTFDLETVEARLAALDEQIKRTRGVVARIKSERAPFDRAAHLARWRLSRLRFMRWIRRPSGAYGLWKLGLLLTGMAFIFTMSFVATDIFIGSLVAALLTSALTAIVAGSVFATILYLPADSRLTDALVEAEIESKIAGARAAHQRATDGLNEQQNRLKDLMTERLTQLAALRSEIAAKMRLRRSLLQQDWRAMRDYEWEEFLVRVFHALGANAQRIGGAGDQGVDLIVEIGSRRVAIQAKGYLNAVNNAAIQQAFTGMAHHQCTDCAVITNSRFTQGAHDIAASTCCILIGEDEFPDLVIGNRKLLEVARAGRS